MSIRVDETKPDIDAKVGTLVPCKKWSILQL